MRRVRTKKCGAGLAALSAMLSGCTSMQNSVVAATGTVIGVEVGTQQGTGAPTGVLGYRRAEFAHVPTNRGTSNQGSVKDVANVVMELNYGAVLSQNGNIYQRLAVGDQAVQAGSAAALFARPADGTTNANVAAAISAAAGTIMTNADKLVNCTTKNGQLDKAAMDKIVERATKAGATGLHPYVDSFQDKMDDSRVRSILKLNGQVANELAGHMTQGDCV